MEMSQARAVRFSTLDAQSACGGSRGLRGFRHRLLYRELECLPAELMGWVINGQQVGDAARRARIVFPDRLRRSVRVTHQEASWGAARP